MSMNINKETFPAPPPPAPADAAVDKVCEAVHKQPQYTHIFMMPFLVTNWW
jgi:hypothetical protein